jgi:hypothetical protein
MAYGFAIELLDRVTKPARTMAQNMDRARSATLRLQSGVDGIVDASDRFRSRLMSLPNLLTGAFATLGVAALGRKVIETTSNFERMEAVLTNTLGSKGAAGRVMRDIQDFAARTPFQVDELTDSWVKLANQGFKPNMDEMTKLGDLASSTGKGFDQLAEAAIDAQVGEFERLKEFGIRAEKSGNKVRFTFKGVQKEVALTDSSIQDYLLSLGEMEGVQGSMAAISATTGGQISNLQDRITMLYKEIADALRPAIATLLEMMAGWIEKMRTAVTWAQENRETVMRWAVALGYVGAAFGALFVAAKIFGAVAGIVRGVALAFNFFVNVIKIARAAMILFNIIVSANPIGLIVIAVAAAIAAIVLLIKNFDQVKAFLIRLGKFLWDHHPFKFLIDLVDRVFPGFKAALGNMLQGVMDAFKKAFDWLNEKVFKPLGKLFKGMFDIDASKFITGKAPALTEEEKAIDPYGRTKSKGGGGGGKSMGGSMAGGLSEVRGSGGSIKNITINIQKLNDGGITVHTTSLGMGTGQVKAELERMLLSVVNDVNYQ